MLNTSDFQLEDRPVRSGDRVVQRIRLLLAWNRPVLEVLTMNEITEVIDEPRRKGLYLHHHRPSTANWANGHPAWNGAKTAK